MVTVPPASGRPAGDTLPMVGAGPRKTKPSASTAERSSRLVTVTVAGPCAPAGVVAVMMVGSYSVTAVAGWAPNSTMAPVAKLVPVSVPAVPPASGPLAGASPDSVGCGPWDRWLQASALRCWSGLTTTTWRVAGPMAVAGAVAVMVVAST